jgi:REP element-mobilizing transposase RayT
VVRPQIERAAAKQDIALLAYCYMPDHVHFLAEGKAENSDCLQFIARGKQYSGYHYKAKFGDRLWQRYRYEHTLRSDERAISVARYILENPVRAGLVSRIEDYLYSGSEVFSIEEILEAVQMPDKWYRRSG